MRIVLVAATIFEIHPFLSKLVHHGEEKGIIRHYQFRNTFIDVMITGIGMIPAAYYLGKHLAGTRYDLAINAGIGGSYCKDLMIGDVVQVTEECITELGAEDIENFSTVFELGLADPDSPPYSHGWLINNILLHSPAIAKLRRVKGATVNTIHGNLLSINKVRDHFQVEVESMEGAACFFAFLTEQMPFAEIRAVSNFVEIRDKTQWNIELAVQNLNKVMEDIFQEVCI